MGHAGVSLSKSFLTNENVFMNSAALQYFIVFYGVLYGTNWLFELGENERKKVESFCFQENLLPPV